MLDATTKDQLAEYAYDVVDTAIATNVLPDIRMSKSGQKITLLQLRQHVCNNRHHDTAQKAIEWIRVVTKGQGWDEYFGELVLVTINLNLSGNPEHDTKAVQFLIGCIYRYGWYAKQQHMLAKSGLEARQPASELAWKKTMLEIVTNEQLAEDEAYLFSLMENDHMSA